MGNSNISQPGGSASFTNENLKPTVPASTIAVEHDAAAATHDSVYFTISLDNLSSRFAHSGSGSILKTYGGGETLLATSMNNGLATYSLIDDNGTPNGEPLFFKPLPARGGEFYAPCLSGVAPSYFEAASGATGDSRMAVQKMPADSIPVVVESFNPTGGGNVNRLLAVMPCDGIIDDIVLLSDTGTSSDASNNLTFQVVNETDTLNLLASAKSTNGAEISADTAYNLGCDQNREFSKGDVLSLTITGNGTPTDLSSAQFRVAVRYVGFEGYNRVFVDSSSNLNFVGEGNAYANSYALSASEKALKLSVGSKTGSDEWVYFDDSQGNADDRLRVDNSGSGNVSVTSIEEGGGSNDGAYGSQIPVKLYIDPTESDPANRLKQNFLAFDFVIPPVQGEDNRFQNVEYVASVAGLYQVYWDSGNSKFVYNNTSTGTDTTFGLSQEVRPYEAIKSA